MEPTNDDLPRYAGDGEDHTSCPDDCGLETIATGLAHTCGLKRDGTVWCWGMNDDAQVGDGTTIDRWSPVQLTPLGTDVVEVAAGSGQVMAYASVVDNASGDPVYLPAVMIDD